MLQQLQQQQRHHQAHSTDIKETDKMKDIKQQEPTTTTTIPSKKTVDPSPPSGEKIKNLSDQQAEQEETPPQTTDVTACDSNSSSSSSSSCEDDTSSSSSSSSSNAIEDEEDDDVAELRLLIAKGLLQLPHQERSQIEQEVHGIQSMGLTQDEEAKPYIQVLFLKQFKDHLESALILARRAPPPSSSEPKQKDSRPTMATTTTTASPSSSTTTSTTSSTTTTAPPPPNTDTYELCMRMNYTYVTNETGSLRLMCLRAELWNPRKACTRFLNHLNALYKYYGDAGLRRPLSIDRLDYEERNRPDGNVNNINVNNVEQPSNSSNHPTESRGIYKKGKGACKRKGSLECLPDMLALKSGVAQVLPSRDRCGRRVIFLQPAGLSIDSDKQTQQHQQHSKFKAMLYFFSALAQSDIEAQRKGFVLLLNSTKTDTTTTSTSTKEQQLSKDKDQQQYNDMSKEYDELYQAIPLRFSAIHLCIDSDDESSTSTSTTASASTIPHKKISVAILQSIIGNNPTDMNNIARIRLYDRDTRNNETQNKIVPFGIPVHQIPITHTGTIKLKEHYQWVKFQEWSETRSCKTNSNSSKFTVIECPGTNDVLFSQGGKHWNGVNRFQRGNLEFMEFLESKIDIYQSTLSWKKKHLILAAVVTEFAAARQCTGERARFLENATQIEGVAAPDGCWVELPLNSPLLMQKIRQTLLNHNRRLEASGKRRSAPTKKARAKPTTTKNKMVVISVKKRKIVHDSTSQILMMKNKLAVATFGDSSMLNNNIETTRNNNNNNNNTVTTTTSNNNNNCHHQQTISEFLANAKRLAVSTVAGIEDDGGGNDCDSIVTCEIHDDEILPGSIDNEERLVQAIIANDDRLNKEVGELFEMDSFLQDGDDGKDGIADCLMGCML